MKTLIAFLILTASAFGQSDLERENFLLRARVAALEFLAEHRVTPSGDGGAGTADPPPVAAPVVVLYTDPPTCPPCRSLEASIQAYGEQNLPFRIERRPPSGHTIPRLEWGKWYHTGYEPIEEFVRRWEYANSLDDAGDASPQSAVARGLELLDLQPGDVLIDPGCGDARVLAAAERTGVEAFGIEIDAERAAAARRDGFDVVTGDASDVDWRGATAAYVYLFEDVLEALKPKLTQLDRFVSYRHRVPGLSMRQDGDFWVWEKPEPEPQRQQIGAWYGGRYYTPENYAAHALACRCYPMCQYLMSEWRKQGWDGTIPNRRAYVRRRG